jgi:type II secretory pathway pseudopilin PulG
MALRARGFTLLEVMIALFIFMVGIVGVLAAIPTGVNSAATVVFQDAAIALAQSKFAEFRRDRVNPSVDLKNGSAYMGARHEPLNSTGVWRDFASGNNAAYQYFDDIERYEWRVDIAPAMFAIYSATPAPYLSPVIGGPADSELQEVTVTVHLRGTTKEFEFTQLIASYN